MNQSSWFVFLIEGDNKDENIYFFQKIFLASLFDCSANCYTILSKGWFGSTIPNN